MYYVKNTILGRLANSLLPHYCCSCGAIGSVFCDSCKYDIISEPFDSCVVCLKPSSTALCGHHRLPYSRVVVAGWRSDGLERLVDASKFESMRPGCSSQAELLAARLPRFVGPAVVVPIPTIRPHIRRRGYGHTERIAWELARLIDHPVEQPIRRIKNHVQHGSTKTVRQRQATEAFSLEGPLRDYTTYLLVDDVFTTGATVQAAAKLLKDAGVRDIWVAVTTRQPRDT